MFLFVTSKHFCTLLFSTNKSASRVKRFNRANFNVIMFLFKKYYVTLICMNDNCLLMVIFILDCFITF